MTGKGADNSKAFSSGFAIRTESIEDRLINLKKKISKKNLVLSN